MISRSLPARRLRGSVLTLSLALLALPGCVRIRKVSHVESLEKRIRNAENKNRAELDELSQRIARLENRNRRLLEALKAGAAAGTALDQLPEGLEVDSEPDGSAEVRAAHRFGGTYRQAIATDPPKLDPAFTQDTTSASITDQILEGLVEFDDELRVKPLLAKRWTVSKDHKTYTFELRENIRFHHGKRLVADDFVFSFGRILDPKTASTRVWLFDRVLGYETFQAFLRAGELARKLGQGETPKREAYQEALDLLEGLTPEHLDELGHPSALGVLALAEKLSQLFAQETVDPTQAESLAEEAYQLSSWDFIARGLEAPTPTTFVIRLGRPFAPFLSVLAMSNASVVPRDKVQELGDKFAFEPVGTGPFKLSKWEHDVVVELEANEDYWDGRPYLDRMTFRIIPDDVTRLTEFEVGNLESLNRVPDEKYPQIKSDPKYPGVLVEKPILHVFYIAMNVEKAPFDNPKVRQAFNHAIKKKLIIEKIRKGRGIVAKGPLPPGMKSYDPKVEGFSYDPAKAKALLKEAGYESGADLGIVDFWFNSSNPNDVNSKIAEVFQQDLAEIGVQLRLNPVDWGTYLDMTDRGDPAIMRLAWIADYPDADNFLYVLFHSKAIGQGNASRYSDPQVDAWLDEARESSDQAHRIALYRKAQAKIVADSPWIPLFHETGPFLKKPYVRDAVLTGQGADNIKFKGVWLDKEKMVEMGIDP